MERKSKAKFTMKGHTLPGINQKSDVNLKDGRSPSSAFQQSALKQKLNENPHAHTSNYWRGYTGESGRTASGLGKTTRYEDEFYKENPYMSPTAEEQDIFVGKDIEETRDQYDPYKGKRYAVSETGQPVTQSQDMGGNRFNDEAYINRAKKLERKKEAENKKRNESGDMLVFSENN